MLKIFRIRRPQRGSSPLRPLRHQVARHQHDSTLQAPLFHTSPPPRGPIPPFYDLLSPKTQELLSRLDCSSQEIRSEKQRPSEKMKRKAVIGLLLSLILLWMIDAYYMVVPMVAFVVYGVLSELKKGKKGIFSDGPYLVPSIVPLFLLATYMIMFLDGQIFTQKILGISFCLLNFTMISIYAVRNRSRHIYLAVAAILMAASTWVMLEQFQNIRYSYDMQTHFNRAVKLHS